MTEITVATLNFETSGSMTCMFCDRRVIILGPLPLLTWQTVGRLRIVDVESGRLIHDCERHLQWFCTQCDEVHAEILWASTHRKRPRLECNVCGAVLTQRPVESAPQD
jgi:hypothetical protein